MGAESYPIGCIQDPDFDIKFNTIGIYKRGKEGLLEFINEIDQEIFKQIVEFCNHIKE